RFQTRDGNDVARLGNLYRGSLEATEGQDLADPTLLQFLALARQRVDGVAWLGAAREHPSGEDALEEGVALDGGHQHAERALLHLGGGHVRNDLVEQRRQALARPIRLLG